MAQNPQVRSQPSAIFTYAHGRGDAGRGRLSRSKDGTVSAATARAGLRPIFTAVVLGAPPAAPPTSIATPKPAIWSASGRLSRSSAP